MSELIDKIEKAIRLARYEKYKRFIAKAKSLAEKGEYSTTSVESGYMQQKWQHIGAYYDPLFKAKSMAKEYGFGWNGVKEKRIVTSAKQNILAKIEKDITRYIEDENINYLNGCKHIVEFLEKEDSEEFLYPRLPRPNKEKEKPWGPFKDKKENKSKD